MSEFGVIICTCKFDFFLAKSCVASVRFALGDVPITLFIDDDLQAGAFARHYGINLLYRRDIQDIWLRTVNTGWGFPKMTMLWESPYEKFLYIDCDTTVWGNVVKAHLDPFDADMIIDPGDPISRPWLPEAGTDRQIQKEYINIPLLNKVLPAFPWEKYRRHYFCSGVWAATRNCLSMAAYQNLFELHRTNPGVFKSGEMALLNILIFEAEEKGEINVKRAPIQTVCEFQNQAYLRETFVLDSSGPNTSQSPATVLHFTDPKPLTISPGFNEPVQFFREKCAREYLGLPAWAAKTYLGLEEMNWRLRVAYRQKLGGMHVRVRKIIRRILGKKP